MSFVSLTSTKLIMLNNGCDHVRSLLPAGSCTCFVFLSTLDSVLQNSYYYYQFFPPNVCLFLHSEMKYRYGEREIWKHGTFCLVGLCQHYSVDHFLQDWAWTNCADWTEVQCHQCVPSFSDSVKCCNLPNWLTWVEMVNFIKPPYNTAPAA